MRTFPDRRSYRIHLEDLREEEIQQRLRAIWTNPHSLDPAKISAEVTRDIAERLANIAKRLEGKHDPRDVAEFLMRCLFTMFAEDVELLPKESFAQLLEGLKAKPETFTQALEHLWKTMDEGGYEPRMGIALKRFNGTLFKHRKALPLDADGIHELWVAAKRDWRDVEPAIFGTLLERALDPRERSKLGAHYTPRAYVERLVVPTIIEPLRADWELVQSAVKELLDKNKPAEAIAAIKTFHHALCTTRVLDPACGTGNFLYVSLELMKRLEGEVLEALEALGEDAPKFAMEGETVGPRQFYGLELNPRAVVIADLVLWIGYLKWQLKTTGLESITEPVLDAYGTIRHQDAILNYDKTELVRDDDGKPLTRWDGVTMKPHPITGEDVPDADARIEIYTYINPRKADWPEAEFIVGNPPFIGNKRMKSRLGEGYCNALRSTYEGVPESVDFVMYWWNRCAELVTERKTRLSGLVTTNKITQNFNRRVVERHISSKSGVSIAFAIPDHVWADTEDAAAVRVAMSVVGHGKRTGTSTKIVVDGSLKEDFSIEKALTRTGSINASLDVGANITELDDLLSNSALAHQGVIPIGKGFRVTSTERQNILKSRPDEALVIKPYKIGRDIQQRDQNLYIIDLFGFEWHEVENYFPATANLVLTRVKPQRVTNGREKRRELFWLFADSCIEMRNGISDLSRYVVTCRTAKHRTFQYVSSDVIPDAKIIALTIEDGSQFSAISSRVHCVFANNTGGWQGAGNDPVYQHSDTFNPFPSPACVTDESNPQLRARLAELGERLDAFRKERLAEHDFLTMTGLYNVLERLRELDNGCDALPLNQKEKDIHEAGLVSVLKSIHDDIDRATFEAYGWQDLGARLIGRPGATMPSPHKSEDQEQAEEELLTRLVALNLERQEEEKKGKVRWLRPDYQIPKLGHKVAVQDELDVGEIQPAVADQPKWPSDAFEQIKIVRDVLIRAPAPALPGEIAVCFAGKPTQARRRRIGEVLDTLIVTGGARSGQLDGETRYFVPR
jgi:hypothetical protein